MKILSINGELTLSEHQIALNVDEEITPELVALLQYGSMKFTGIGTVLVVQKTEHVEAFSRAFVSTLQRKLDEAQLSVKDQARRTQRMKELLAESTGLPLAG